MIIFGKTKNKIYSDVHEIKEDIKRLGEVLDKEDNQVPINDTIKSTIKKDGGFYVSVLILLGYLFTTVQQIARYSYYGVELTYLLNIKLEDILLGLLYVIVLVSIPLLAYETVKYPHKRRIVYCKQGILLVFFAVFAFALTQRLPIDFFSLFLIVFLATDVVAKIIYKTCRDKIKKWIDNTPVLIQITLILTILIISVLAIQFTIEAYNKRFTYIAYNGEKYAVLTTFHDNFITLESDISGDTITIYRGHVKLVPINDAVIEEGQFVEKILR